MPQRGEIVIVGAGLVGSLLGLMLGQRGWRVTVLDKRPDIRHSKADSGRSINLALAERGIHALREAGVMEEIDALLVPMRGRMLHSVDGALDFAPYGQQAHEVIYSASRTGLNRRLVAAADRRAEVTFAFGQECRAVDLQNRRLQVCDVSTGATRTIEFEVVIGADGVASVVRDAVVSAAGGTCTVEMLDHWSRELTIPAAAGGGFQMEREALHIWPRGGHMLIALPNLDGSFTVTLFLPKSGAVSFDSIEDSASLRTFFEHQFRDATSFIRDLDTDYFANPLGKLGTVRCDRWTFRDRALLVGDAAHAIVPFHGQGMNAGFEDCSELCRLLAEFEGDWARALPEFERERIPNANAIADMALENYVTMRDSVVDESFRAKRELGFALERLFPSQFIPRYSMVMFHRMPYAEAQRRGRAQEALLTFLLEQGVTSEDLGKERKMTAKRDATQSPLECARPSRRRSTTD